MANHAAQSALPFVSRLPNRRPVNETGASAASVNGLMAYPVDRTSSANYRST